MGEDGLCTLLGEEKSFLYFSSWRVEGIVSCSGETRGVGDEKVEQF